MDRSIKPGDDFYRVRQWGLAPNINHTREPAELRQSRSVNGENESTGYLLCRASRRLLVEMTRLRLMFADGARFLSLAVEGDDHLLGGAQQKGSSDVSAITDTFESECQMEESPDCVRADKSR